MILRRLVVCGPWLLEVKYLQVHSLSLCLSLASGVAINHLIGSFPFATTRDCPCWGCSYVRVSVLSISCMRTFQSGGAVSPSAESARRKHDRRRWLRPTGVGDSRQFRPVSQSKQLIRNDYQKPRALRRQMRILTLKC